MPTGLVGAILEVGLISQSFASGPAAATLLKSAQHTKDLQTRQDMLSIVLERLDEDQAQDVLSIDLFGKSDVADAMVVATGRSQRHVGAMADKISRDLKEAGHTSPSIEGLPACDWVLIDAGDVIVHLFRPEVRGFYNLERIWAPELFEADEPESSYVPETDAISGSEED